MEELTKKMRAVRRRLLWIRFLSVTLLSLLWLTALAAVTLVVCRLIVPIENEALWKEWTWLIVAGLVALAIPIGLLSTLIRRTSLFQAALVSDERLDLRERISSAILLRGPRRPMEELLEADAVRAAARIHPGRDFPFTPPSALRFLPVPLMALGLTALLLNQHNLLASSESNLTEELRQALEIETVDNDRRAQELADLASSLEEVTSNISSPEEWQQLRESLDRMAEQLRETDASRLEQLAELSDLADEMDRRRSEMEERFSSQRNFTADPGSQMTQSIQQAMEEGDFEEAQAQVEALMEELQQQMADGELDPENMEQLAQELAQMAEQMGGSSSETGQALQQAAQAMQMAASAMSQSQSGGTGDRGNNSQASQAAQAAMNQAMSQMAQAMGDLSDAQAQLAIADALAADLNAARAALARDPSNNPQLCEACRSGQGQCRGGNCPGTGKPSNLAMLGTGQWRAGETLGRRGNGTGGPGQGRGGRPPESDGGDTRFTDESLSSQRLPGLIIAEFRHDDGVQIAGESSIAISNAFLTYEQEAEQTLETEVIPAGYRAITRDYFRAVHPVQTGASGDEDATP